jgi:hypothetical protein
MKRRIIAIQTKDLNPYWQIGMATFTIYTDEAKNAGQHVEEIKLDENTEIEREDRMNWDDDEDLADQIQNAKLFTYTEDRYLAFSKAVDTSMLKSVRGFQTYVHKGTLNLEVAYEVTKNVTGLFALQIDENVHHLN